MDDQWPEGGITPKGLRVVRPGGNCNENELIIIDSIWNMELLKTGVHLFNALKIETYAIEV